MSKKTGKKMMQWIFGIGLGIAIAAGAVFLFQANRSKKSLAEYIRAHPDSTAVVAYTLDENGQPVLDGSEIFHNPDAPLVLASTMKTVVVAAYEAAVERGELDPNEMVSIADLEQFYLPRTDGGAHATGLAKLGQATDADGFAKDPSARIALDDIARIVIHNSGNAETDYLLARLGAERVAAVLSAAGMEHHGPVHSILGVSLAMFNHEAPLSDAARRQALVAEVASGDFSALENLVDLYLHDPEWRSAQLAFMKSDAFLDAANQMGWDGQVEAGQLFPKGTAREYAYLMAQIASGTLISPAVSARLAAKTGNHASRRPDAATVSPTLWSEGRGDRGRAVPGQLRHAERRALAGKTRVVVIFTNDLPYAAWSKMMQFQSIYLLQADFAKKGWQ